jgi:hypothetical protein
MAAIDIDFDVREFLVTNNTTPWHPTFEKPYFKEHESSFLTFLLYFFELECLHYIQ